jgi:hypothetical protein
MAKKCLLNKIDPVGPNNEGYPVLEVVDSGSTFEASDSFEWIDCPDDIVSFTQWYNPNNQTFHKLPAYIETGRDTPLAVDENGVETEKYEFDWVNEVWTKVQIINQ